MELRVLHVVESFDGQATEAWLLRALRSARASGRSPRWTFYCARGVEGAGADEARDAGAVVRASAATVADKGALLHDLRSVLRAGPYDVLHAHHDIVSGLYLAASVGLRLRRIVHVHNTELGLPTPSRLKTALVREPLRRVCLGGADHIVGVSSAALGAFLDGRPPRPSRDLVLHCGVAEGPIPPPPRRDARAALRAELGLSPDARIVLFVGRMIPYKNPRFVVDVLDALARAEPEAVAVFAGRGDEEAAVEAEARARGLADRVRLLGWRDDVAHLMRASDVLLWPSVESPMEGLGLGTVEAQAVGLPVVLSHSVPADAVVIPGLVMRLPLVAGAEAWAAAVASALARGAMDEAEARAAIARSSFGLERSTSRLRALHEGGHESLYTRPEAAALPG